MHPTPTPTPCPPTLPVRFELCARFTPGSYCGYFCAYPFLQPQTPGLILIFIHVLLRPFERIWLSKVGSPDNEVCTYLTSLSTASFISRMSVWIECPFPRNAGGQKSFVLLRVLKHLHTHNGISWRQDPSLSLASVSISQTPHIHSLKVILCSVFSAAACLPTRCQVWEFPLAASHLCSQSFSFWSIVDPGLWLRDCWTCTTLH